MHRPRPPWRTGEDTQSKVLDRVIRDAMERPEIAAELAPGGDKDDAFNEAYKVVSAARASVIASGEAAETRYRELADKAMGATFGLFERFPLAGELMVLVLIPLWGLAGLGGLLSTKVSEVNSWLSLAAIAGPVLAAGGWMLWHKRSRAPMSLPARIWAWFGIASVGATYGWTIVEGMGWSWGLIIGLGIAAVLPAICVAVVRTVFPNAGISARQGVAVDGFEEWCQTLLRDGVLPVLFTKINAASAQTYSTTLTARGTLALTRANPVTMHVPTPASRRLTRLVDQLGGGSFALDGPRGAGKSNLLKAFCGGRYRDDKRHPDLAVLVSAPVEYVPHEFVLHLFGTTCRAANNDPGQLGVAARENLNLLSYVHSYAREITAKGGFRGLELGRKRGVTLQGRALTYPELVDRFREFLWAAVTALIAESKRDGKEPGRVVIGIDELDRLGSGEPARRFLNELKAIFDVPGCYYLVSVSTEAQHDFELSGMGLRSVFDSSFDEVVRVDYLDFEDAKKLLRRCVIGLSEQFLALAYVFSGGLARQLVRTARLIIEHTGASLPAVAQDLARLEMVTVCRASADVLATVDQRADLLRVLDDPPRKIAGDELRSYANRLYEARLGSSERVRELRDGVRDRMWFLATVLDLFTNDLTEQRLLGVDFDTMARARRYLRG